MSEMIDRAARAVKARASEIAAADESEDWFAEQYARAALQAIREPSEAMVEAGGLAGDLPMRAAIETWRAMINVALAQHKTDFPSSP